MGSAFAFHLKELWKFCHGEVSLELTSDEPVFQRHRQLPPGDDQLARAKCQELLEAGLIRESTSSYAAATLMAERTDITKAKGAKRMCGDYRTQNKVIKPDPYSMPSPKGLFDKLAGKRVFSTLNLRQGFNRIRIADRDIHKTAFHGPDRLYEWCYMPFGLNIATAKFQQVMHHPEQSPSRHVLRGRRGHGQ